MKIIEIMHKATTDIIELKAKVECLELSIAKSKLEYQSEIEELRNDAQKKQDQFEEFRDAVFKVSPDVSDCWLDIKEEKQQEYEKFRDDQDSIEKE